MLDILKRIFRILIPPVFTITINNGIAQSTQGKVTNKVLGEFSEIPRQQGISGGTIYGVRKNAGISLDFSGNISKAVQQRFRNVWSLVRF